MGATGCNEADPTGDWSVFEKGAEKTAGGDGFADVWKRGHFAWEYKGKRKDLAAAYRQLLEYREALKNPPLMVVCVLDRFEVHTNFTGTVKQVHAFNLADLASTPKEPLRAPLDVTASLQLPDLAHELIEGPDRAQLRSVQADAVRFLSEWRVDGSSVGRGPKADGVHDAIQAILIRPALRSEEEHQVAGRHGIRHFLDSGCGAVGGDWKQELELQPIRDHASEACVYDDFSNGVRRNVLRRVTLERPAQRE